VKRVAMLIKKPLKSSWGQGSILLTVSSVPFKNWPPIAKIATQGLLATALNVDWTIFAVPDVPVFKESLILSIIPKIFL